MICLSKWPRRFAWFVAVLVGIIGLVPSLTASPPLRLVLDGAGRFLVAFALDGRRLAALTEDRASVLVVDLTTGRRQRFALPEALDADWHARVEAIFSPGGRWLCLGRQG